jgi:hypothetical protein
MEKVEGSGQVSFKYTLKNRFEIGLTYFGNFLIEKMSQVIAIKSAKGV